MKMKKSSNISATALHRFIPQPASGRSSALPCLAAFLVLSDFWRLLRLHGLFFRPISKDNSLAEQLLECYNDKVDRSVYESSVLSIAEVYVNTCENNTLSARQNADLLKIRTYSSNDPYDLF